MFLHYITYIGYNNYAYYTNYNWFLLIFRQSSPMTNMARVISIIQLNMTKVHTLVGGGGQHGGFNALDYRKIKHRNAGLLGTYHILYIAVNPLCPTGLRVQRVYCNPLSNRFTAIPGFTAIQSRCPTGLLQSISRQTLSQQSSLGHGHDQAAWYR